ARHRHDATPEDWRRFWEAYVSMGLKDPGCYLVATMNNYYGYFYPSWNVSPFYTYYASSVVMERLRDDAGIDIHHSEDPAIRILASVDNSYTWLFQWVPFLRMLMKSCTWCWALILVTLYAAHRRWTRAVPILVTLWTVMLVVLIGPVDGGKYNRYVYPIAVVLPFVMALLPALEGRVVTALGDAVEQR
ncbi:MAG: hypothetical protein IJH87_01680, partial [Atopobiaceae bacterium]|nr:hypothetical protein [Atopobiaceae bacterium]